MINDDANAADPQPCICTPESPDRTFEAIDWNGGRPGPGTRCKHCLQRHTGECDPHAALTAAPWHDWEKQVTEANNTSISLAKRLEVAEATVARLTAALRTINELLDEVGADLASARSQAGE